MPYIGREHYHFVEDVGAGFAMSAMADFSDGYDEFNLRGITMETTGFLAEINTAAAELELPVCEITTARRCVQSPVCL